MKHEEEWKNYLSRKTFTMWQKPVSLLFWNACIFKPKPNEGQSPLIQWSLQHFQYWAEICQKAVGSGFILAMFLPQLEAIVPTRILVCVGGNFAAVLHRNDLEMHKSTTMFFVQLTFISHGASIVEIPGKLCTKWEHRIFKNVASFFWGRIKWQLNWGEGGNPWKETNMGDLQAHLHSIVVKHSYVQKPSESGMYHCIKYFTKPLNITRSFLGK